jgi:hypothetical protein
MSCEQSSPCKSPELGDYPTPAGWAEQAAQAVFKAGIGQSSTTAVIETDFCAPP